MSLEPLVEIESKEALKTNNKMMEGCQRETQVKELLMAKAGII